MRICFVLPQFTRQPIGGYKIVFEYANRLRADGNNVIILFLNEESLKQFRIPLIVKKRVANYLTHIEPRWFELDVRIKKVSSYEKNYMTKVGNVDKCFATGIQTVEFVKNNFPNADKLYLIQGYENWSFSSQYVNDSYRLGFKNIVVSSWLKEIVDKYAKRPAYLLKNPIDINLYKCYKPQDKRKKYTLGLLYHTDPNKGAKYALQAIVELKKMYNDLEVFMFGMFPRPNNLPEWINYKRGATAQETVEIYNKVQVFLCASIEEGYGLTGLEAMACGACLVSTAYKGVLEYATNGYNALLSPVKDTSFLVKNVSKLFQNGNERKRISRNGIDSVKEYSWYEAMKRLYKIMEKR